MAYRLLFICILLLSTSSAVTAKKLSVERLYSSPALAGDSIKNLKMSPDGTRVTFLKGKEKDYERLDLWEYDIASGETRMLFDSDNLHTGAEQLSDEEKARRERMRLKGTGIVSYQWSSDGQALLFPLAGDLYYFRLGDKDARKLLSTPEFETDSKISPLGNYVSYIRAQNLFVFDLTENKEIQLTVDGGGPIKNGMAEFVAQEEMSRYTGYWWSNDESKIAFTRVDESPVEEITRSEIYAEEIKTITQRYPSAGTDNVQVKLAVIELSNAKVQWVDLGKTQDIYLPRVQWTQDNNVLSYQWQSRDQKELRLHAYDWRTKKSRVLLNEKSDTWINLHDDLKFLNDTEQFVWASERDGYQHLYLYKNSGELVRQLTSGDWIVDEVEGIDENNGEIYFSGRKDTPLEKHLYAVPLSGGEIKKVTQRSGFHSIEFSKDSQRYIDQFSTATTPPQVSLHNVSGEHLTWLLENKVNDSHPLYEYMQDWIEPEFGSFLNSDKTRLHYRLYKPAEFDPSKKYPVLVFLYGGPLAQMVKNQWGRPFVQYMAQQGYVVFTLDNRGAAGYGKAFEDTLYRAMGSTEVDDQIAGVKYLHSKPWVDQDKIGVHGHSYGGYMTLMCMFKAADFFKAGVAGSPVTDWSLYDTHYTERYMGHPKKDAQAYENSSVFPYAKDLAGPLLIYHGMADDNVLFKNSTKLYKLLQDNNIPFWSMDYPGKKHSIRGKQTQMHRANLIRNFFDLQFGIKRQN